MAPSAEEAEGSVDMVTSTRDRILEYIREYCSTNGYGPTMREIADAVGVASKNTVAYHVRQLEAQGHIMRRAPRRHRSIIPAGEGGEQP